MKKQSSIDWFAEQIEAGKIEIIYSDKIHSIRCISSIVEQAKLMHEHEVKDAYIAANNVNETRNPEQYYKDTFA